MNSRNGSYYQTATHSVETFLNIIFKSFWRLLIKTDLKRSENDLILSTQSLLVGGTFNSN